MATSHLHQAAVVLRSLPDPQAARLLKELSPRQAAAISGEIARLDRPGGDEQEIAIREFTAAARKRGLSPFVPSTLRAVPAYGDCPRFPKRGRARLKTGGRRWKTIRPSAMPPHPLLFSIAWTRKTSSPCWPTNTPKRRPWSSSTCPATLPSR